MKKIVCCLLFLFLLIPVTVFGADKDINLYLFYGDGCPHCAAEEEFLAGYMKKNPNVHLYDYEVWHNEYNSKLLGEVQTLLNDTSSGVPFLIIGNNVISGFLEDYTEEIIVNTINYYKAYSYVDGVGIYLGVVPDEGLEWDKSVKYHVDSIDDLTVPDYLDKIVKNSPLIISAIVIGFVDGLNPCAMWILLFLISMLLGVEDKKRKYGLGIAFLFASALIYFLFLVSWLNVATFLDKLIWVRYVVSIASVSFGCYSIFKFFNSLNKNDGCDVVSTSKRRLIIDSIKKIVKEKSFILAILGVMALAACVNIIELMCSLGLPVLFSELLVLNDVTGAGKYIYSLIYVFFFLIDDIIIFIIAMKTMEIKAISNKVGKYAHLIGGIIMLLIGLLMVYKPEWLMLNF